jgi:integrase
MATLTKTPAGAWKAVIRKKGWPTASKTFRTKRDAQDWARRVEDEMVRGVYLTRAPSERLTLEAALERYLTEVSPTKSPGTAQRERDRAKPLNRALGRYALAAITPDVVAQYRDQRLASVSANTVRLEFALLGHLFTTAIREWGLGLQYNPVQNVRKPSAGSGRKRRLSRDEETRLLAACDASRNPMLGWIVRVALLTAMRSGEISSLRLSQVDLGRRVVRLDHTKNGTQRTVPLSQEAVAVFREALNHPVRPPDTDLVFWGERGRSEERRPYVFTKAWYGALSRAGIEDMHFHDLRHEATSRLVEAGFSDQEVAAITGHKTMQMLKRYTHLRAEDLTRRMDELGARSSAP